MADKDTATIQAGFENARDFAQRYASYLPQGGSDRSKAALSPKSLRIDWMKTARGPMLAICDDTHLWMLEFITRKALAWQFEKFYKRHGQPISIGRTQITDQIEKELGAYFSGQLTEFKTPFMVTGTDFQKATWQQLCNIPYGQTRSYAQLAEMVGNPKAVRAVANANAKNGLVIIVPCHRVIGSDGGLGGYAGGVSLKSKLLNIESHKL
ncbi:MAG: methylated-DNA--[protein]-cysteine S-methyltransferase [Litorimonas sp.]